jgi:hypothetical protein
LLRAAVVWLVGVTSWLTCADAAAVLLILELGFGLGLADGSSAVVAERLILRLPKKRMWTRRIYILSLSFAFSLFYFWTLFFFVWSLVCVCWFV